MTKAKPGLSHANFVITLCAMLLYSAPAMLQRGGWCRYMKGYHRKQRQNYDFVTSINQHFVCKHCLENYRKLGEKEKERQFCFYYDLHYLKLQISLYCKENINMAHEVKIQWSSCYRTTSAVFVHPCHQEIQSPEPNLRTVTRTAKVFKTSLGSSV